MALPFDPGSDPLTKSLYAEMRKIARGAMRGERQDHTLEPTALANEAFLRLSNQQAAFRDRQHFLVIAATAMRRILVDHARRRGAAKRPTSDPQVTLSGVGEVAAAQPVAAKRLAEALAELERLDPRAVRNVELRLLVGCTADETAKALGVSRATVQRDWRMAKSWLRTRLEPA